jgi:hypothetical protein
MKVKCKFIFYIILHYNKYCLDLHNVLHIGEVATCIKLIINRDVSAAIAKPLLAAGLSHNLKQK